MDDFDHGNVVYDDFDFEFKGWNTIYDETFLKYLDLLSQRSERLQHLDNSSLDYITYTDMCLVMVRAILVENEKRTNNYTLQNYLHRHSRDDLVDKANQFIKQYINKKHTLRDALKIVVDKFTVHYDAMTKMNSDFEEEWDIDSQFTRLLFLSDIKRTDSYPFTIPRIVAFVQSLVDQAQKDEIEKK